MYSIAFWFVIGVAAVVVLLVLIILGGMEGRVESVRSVDPAAHVVEGRAVYVCRPVANAHSRFFLWLGSSFGNHHARFDLPELGVSGYVWDGTTFVTKVARDWHGCPRCRSHRVIPGHLAGRSGEFTTCLNCHEVFQTLEQAKQSRSVTVRS